MRVNIRGRLRGEHRITHVLYSDVKLCLTYKPARRHSVVSEPDTDYWRGNAVLPHLPLWPHGKPTNPTLLRLLMRDFPSFG